MRMVACDGWFGDCPFPAEYEFDENGASVLVCELHKAEYVDGPESGRVLDDVVTWERWQNAVFSDSTLGRYARDLLHRVTAVVADGYDAENS